MERPTTGLRQDEDADQTTVQSVVQLERPSSPPDTAALRRRMKSCEMEVGYLKERESELRLELSRVRAENVAMSAKLKHTDEAYREALAARRSARDALSEMAEQNAQLVAAFIEKKQDLRSVQETVIEERRKWAERLEALEEELKIAQSQLRRVQSSRAGTSTMSESASEYLSGTSMSGSEEDLPTCMPHRRSLPAAPWGEAVGVSLRTLHEMRAENQRLQEENSHLRRSCEEATRKQRCHDLHQTTVELKKRGNHLFKCEKYQEAADVYSQALDLGLEDTGVIAILRCNRAAAFLNLGRFLEALADCFASIASDGSYMRAFQRRAEVFVALGDFSSAAHDLKKVLAQGGGRLFEARSLHTDVVRRASSGQGIDAYRVLGLSPSATALEVKSSYRQLALKYHPDKATHVAGAEVLFKLVAEANTLLADPHKRELYDASAWRRTRASFRSTRF